MSLDRLSVSQARWQSAISLYIYNIQPSREIMVLKFKLYGSANILNRLFSCGKFIVVNSSSSLVRLWKISHSCPG